MKGLYAWLLLLLFTGMSCSIVPFPEPTAFLSLDRSSYSIRDYMLTNSARLVFSNLNEGDRIVIIPLYKGLENGFEPPSGMPGLPVEDGESLETVMACRLEALYEGNPPLYPSPRYSGNDSRPDMAGKTAVSDSIHDMEGFPCRRIIRSAAVTHGTQDSFWTETVFFSRNFTRQAVQCLYAGTHCAVFLTTNLVSVPGIAEKVSNIGLTFDTNIYSRVTGLFGYEWGGDPGHPEEWGGVDGDPKVYIYLNGVTTGNEGGGVFRSRNENADQEYSNGHEMFEVFMTRELALTNWYPYSTLAHEFQHLVCFNYSWRRTGDYQLSLFDEGSAQVAEVAAGYPSAYSFSAVQKEPAASYYHWGFHAKGYSAAYTVMDYAFRRFGTNFIRRVTAGRSMGLTGVEDALAGCGYSYGYEGLVLDALSAFYLDADEFRFPAAGLYPGDSGFAMHGAGSNFNSYGPEIDSYVLHGPRTRFYSVYPASHEVRLNLYGADMFEFYSGQNGRITLQMTSSAPGLRLRAIVYRAQGLPRIDGDLSDWAGLSAGVLSDPAGDNNYRTYNETWPYTGYPQMDVKRVLTLITNSNLYLGIETSAALVYNTWTNMFGFYADRAGGVTWENYAALAPGHFYFYIYDTSNYVRTNVDLAGLEYQFGNSLEAVVPLGIFGPGLTNGPLKIRIQAQCYISNTYVYDRIPDISIPIP